ncbi:MAG: DEAD/DEAH box helicase [Betaproteobacteria bacterium]|nr:DEAD/DEAH box helicase [Betaproteobacteria bacterium]
MKPQAPFGWEIADGGVTVFAIKKTIRVKIESLSSNERLAASLALARIQAAIENGESGYTALEDGTGYWLAPKAVQALDSNQAESLNLPPTCPFSLWIKLTGPFTAPTTKALASWHDVSGTRVAIKENSGLAIHGSKAYRIPANLAAIQVACTSFNDNADDLDERLAAMSILKQVLEEASGEAIGTDKQIIDMRFRHASTLSIDVSVDPAGVNFDPIFFSREVKEQALEAGDVIKQSESLLTPEMQKNLAVQFRHGANAKPTYVLARGEYLFIDPSIRPALEVIKEQQGKSADERSRFARSPQSFFRERYLKEGFTEDQVDQVVVDSFVETDAFSERVIQVGLWRPPILPFIKRAPNAWFPESFGLKIGSKIISIPESEIEPLAKSVAKAIKEGAEEVSVPGTQETVPATLDALDSLNAILQLFLKIPPVTADDGEDGKNPEPSVTARPEPGETNKAILVVQDNFVDEVFIAQFAARTCFTGFEQPSSVKTQLKAHQVNGVTWLQKAWSVGYPGVLLADDMGLGKTLQVLAFICWLKTKQAKIGLTPKPALVVAPISLLGNWESEVQSHVSGDGLGLMTRLYGESLRRYRLSKSSRPDVIEGKVTLDLTSLRASGWILTTYETMRDYNLSLGAIEFSVIAFDEMQKIKNPQSMMTNAAQALHGDFKVGMTGTPIENSLADIWTLFDTLMPGALGLGDLRAFLNRYKLDNPDALRSLKDRLTEETDEKPAPMIRRMKSDVAKDLPEKIEQSIERMMPEAQAIAYVSALKSVNAAQGKRSKLEAFHRIRGISLHPRFATQLSSSNPEEHIGESARLISCFQLLDQIHRKNEKVLVFIESIAMQEWMSFTLKERYNLGKFPGRIFGDTSAEKRTQVVEQFQTSPKQCFDVLILSPRAAGVGLTLTAATHVIHLSRWWNPAVEDQCTDRAYRIGQTRDVTVYYLQAVHPLYGNGSFDCILNELLIRKRALSRGMLMPAETGEELDQMLERLNSSVT